MTNCMKTCSFIRAYFIETMKVVEILFKKAYGENLVIEKSHMLSVRIEIASVRQFHFVPTTYAAGKNENYWMFNLPSSMSVVFGS